MRALESVSSGLSSRATSLASTRDFWRRRTLALALGVMGFFVSPRHACAQHLSEYVNTLRGSNSTPGYSYGNTFPGVTVPFGFNFWTPVSSSNSHSWIFDYQAEGIEGFAASHEPSPWIGDHGAFQIMPMVGALQTVGSVRRATYDHANETAHAHYYSVLFDNGIRTEFSPTDHAVVFKFTFPQATEAHILFDTEDEVGAGNPVQGDVTVNQAGRSISGHVDHRGPRIYFYAEIDKAIGSVFDGPNAQAALNFSTSAGEVVVLKLATSFLSVDQAEANLAQEVGDRSFDQVFEQARTTWDETLGKIEVEGATEDQLVTFYSNLYRAFMYPNSMWEDVDGTPTYFSPYSNEVKTGKIYVNNGFWDTFRAAWPLYLLLVPEKAGEMLDGFVNAYKDGGWTPRWSGPGYIDIMVGSHSDILFADAYVKGVTNFDTEAAFASMLKNALVYSGNGSLGRKGNARSIFKGYIPVEDLGESAAWYLEDTIADFGIYKMAEALDDETHRRYFEQKALTYVNLFSPSVGFFRGKRENGEFRTPDAEFFPNEWGYEFTEGCAWHYATAAQNDPQGMANLYGGRAALSAKIDSLFSASPDFLVGSYGGVIHEMLEAFDTNMGQYAHANEPIHHMLYMYNYAGTPWKTQEHVRAVLDLANGIYGPGYDGRGYLGDEDNGQMSAWYIFSALGFYPASPGHPEYAIGSPLFKKATIHLENGQDFVVDAQLNSDANRYIQDASLDGVAQAENFLTHEQILAGGTLDLTMAGAPSTWGSGDSAVPTSMTSSTRAPRPASDCSLGATISASQDSADLEGAVQAFDDSSATKWLATGTTGSLAVEFEEGRRFRVGLYTMTSANDVPERDPRSWTLSGSNDGITWDALDTRADEVFEFRRQTRVFSADALIPYANYRLDISENGGAPLLQLAELELIPEASVTTVTATGTSACAPGEEPDRAVDGRLETKWCSADPEASLTIDLGGKHLVYQVLIHHAGTFMEGDEQNSRDFRLLGSTDGENFEVLEDVVENTSSVTQHTLEEMSLTHLSLEITTPTQTDEDVARIYEVEVFGTKEPEDPTDPEGTGGSDPGVTGTGGGGDGTNSGGTTGAGSDSSARKRSRSGCSYGPAGSRERSPFLPIALGSAGVGWMISRSRRFRIERLLRR